MTISSFARIAVCVAVIGAAVSVCATDRSFTSNGITLGVQGQSGSIKLYTAADSNNFIQIKQSGLQEVDAQGNSVSGGHSVSISSGGDAQWTPVMSYTQADGVVYAATQFTNTYTVAQASVAFSLLVRLYSNTTTVNAGAVTMTVVQNSVKFDANITGWPFAASGNQLQWSVELSSKGGDNDGRTSNNRGSGKQAVVFQNGLMDYPLTATVDGTAGASVSVALATNGNNKQTLTFSFPSAQRTIWYDPVLCLGCTDSAAPATASAVSAALLFALIAVSLAAERSF